MRFVDTAIVGQVRATRAVERFHPDHVCLPQEMETYWLADSPFLAASEDISIADLLICCELDQLSFVDGADSVRECSTPRATQQGRIG
jgi:hypothetical protein